MLKKIAIVFGTRPEAIKLATVIKEIEKRSEFFEALIISTGQHREMLAQVLEIFNVKPHIALQVMEKDQDIIDVTSKIIQGLNIVFKESKPGFVIVQGIRQLLLHYLQLFIIKLNLVMLRLVL